MHNASRQSPVGQNWAGTHSFRAAGLALPESVDDLRRLVEKSTASGHKLRALGTRHSFNDLADGPCDLVGVTRISPDPRIDPHARTVTVGAGIRYGDLAVFLESEGWALHNMGSLPHISVGGAIATATHGSGDRNGSLSSAVSGLELVTAEGDLLVVDRRHPDFAGMVVALGALGVVTRVTLDIQPSYLVRQDLYYGLPWDALLADVGAITSSAYSVSLFTDWLGETIGTVWLKSRLDEDDDLPASFFGASRQPAGGAEGDDGSANRTETFGVPGPWSQRLPHFRLDATPSNGDEIQTEYLIDRSHAVAALSAVRHLGASIQPHLHVTELRTVAADDLWLSTASGRDSLCIHFTWKNEPDAVTALIPQIETALAPFAPRPHWGKWFALEAADLAPVYPRLDEFRDLATRLDPTGTFRNEYLARAIGLTEG